MRRGGMSRPRRSAHVLCLPRSERRPARAAVLPAAAPGETLCRTGNSAKSVLFSRMNRTGAENYGPNFAPRSVHLVADERPLWRMKTPER